MQESGTYRHELKYQICYADYLAVRSRLRTVMKPDVHVGKDGTYEIRSIYFDNYNDKALKEKTDGVQKREKFRLRWYNDDFSFVALEKKMKMNHLCLKLSAKMSEVECRKLCEGRYDWMMDHPNELVRELWCKIQIQQLRPKVIVAYQREPYICEPGNVRVTFDSDIRSSLFHQDLFDQDISLIGVAETPGEMIMEVKYDDFLPEIIMAMLQTENIRLQAFSKYGACRRYG